MTKYEQEDKMVKCSRECWLYGAPYMSIKTTIRQVLKDMAEEDDVDIDIKYGKGVEEFVGQYALKTGLEETKILSKDGVFSEFNRAELFIVLYKHFFDGSHNTYKCLQQVKTMLGLSEQQYTEVIQGIIVDAKYKLLQEGE